MSNKGILFLKIFIYVLALFAIFTFEIFSENDVLTVAQIVESEFIFVSVEEDNECTNEKCISEIQVLSKQITDLETEIMGAKNEYHESLVMNLKKDFMIQDLEDKWKKSRYDSFRNDFGEKIIDNLALMDNSKEKDTLFIRIAMEHLYCKNLSKLKEKTYSGRTKNEITPNKKELLKKLFSKRMEYLEEEKEQADRIKSFGKIMKNAIEYLNKMNTE